MRELRGKKSKAKKSLNRLIKRNTSLKQEKT